MMMMIVTTTTTTNFVDNSLLDYMEAVDHEDSVQLVLLSVGHFWIFYFLCRVCFQQVGRTQIQDIITSSLKHFIFTDARNDIFLRSKVVKNLN